MAMQQDEILARLTEIFRKTFDDDRLTVTHDMTAADVEAWDSLSHINLILAVERAFEIRLTTREVRAMKNVGDFVGLIAKKAA
jgi:acyl carrier protein